LTDRQWISTVAAGKKAEPSYYFDRINFHSVVLFRFSPQFVFPLAKSLFNHPLRRLSAPMITSKSPFPKLPKSVKTLFVALILLEAASHVFAQPVAPFILRQPAPETVADGESVNMAPVATGTSPLFYQWRKGGVPIAGKTALNLAFESVQAADTGDYDCVVSNSVGIATHQPVRLTVQSMVAPRFLIASRVLSLFPGTAFSMSQNVSGSMPMKFQWLKNGSPIFNATNLSYSFSALSTGDTGVYELQAVNSGGMRVSPPFELLVPAPAEASFLGRPFIKLVDNLTTKPGQTTNFIKFDKLNRLTLHDGTVHFLGRITNPKNGPPRMGVYRARVGVLTTIADDSIDVPAPGSGKFYGADFPTDETEGVCNFVGYYNNQVNHALFAYGSGALSILVNGSDVPPGSSTFFGDFFFAVRRGHTVLWQSFTGTAEAGGIYKHDGAGVSGVVTGASDLPGALGPFYGVTDASRIGFDGTTVVFGGSDATHQGYYKSTLAGAVTKLADYLDPIPGSDLTFSTAGEIDVAGGDIFAYGAGRMIDFDEAGSARPTGVSGVFVAASGPREFYATGGIPLVRYKNGVTETVLKGGQIIDGHTVSSVNRFAIEGNDIAVNLTMQGSPAYSAIYLAAGELPPGPPTITTPPQSQKVQEGSQLIVDISAAGHDLIYQWFKDNESLEGEISSSLRRSTARLADGGRYKVKVTSGNESITSAEAMITIAPVDAFQIIKQPISQRVNPGGGFFLTVTAVGTAIGTLNYQWFLEGTLVSSSGSQSLVVTNVQAANTGNYTVTVSNLFYQVTSAPASIRFPEANASFKLDSLTRASGKIAFTIPTEAGKGYTIEYKSNLEDLFWIPLDTFTGDGSTRTFETTTTDPSSYFQAVRDR
jgi:hypothetical protein